MESGVFPEQTFLASRHLAFVVKFHQEVRDPDVACLVVVPAGFFAQRASKKRFAGTGIALEYNALFGFHVLAGGKLSDEGAIQRTFLLTALFPTLTDDRLFCSCCNRGVSSVNDYSIRT